MSSNAAAFQRFAGEIAAAARTRAQELELAWDRELRFAVDYLLTERCAVAAFDAGELTDDEAEATARFLELEIEMTVGAIRETATAEELADAVMCGSDGMHGFLLAHDLIERYLDWNDASGEWLDVLSYGHDDWRTEHGNAGRERARAERQERRAARQSAFSG